MRLRGQFVAVLSLLLALLSPVSASAAGAAPSAAVTSPTAGTEVAGFVTVTGSGQTDSSQSDTPQSLQFYVDGFYVSAQPCAVSAHTCTATFAWDTTALYGQHTLQVRLTTANNVKAMSPAVTVQVGDPPAAYITSPAAGATVNGVVSVVGGGTVDPLQPDMVKSLQLVVDGVPGASIACSAGNTLNTAQLCLGTLSWDSTGLSGSHQLQLQLTTAKNQVALSPVVTVMTANAGPTVVLTPTAATVSGTVSVKARGTVDPTQTDTAAMLRLLVDGVSNGTSACSGKNCQGSFSWKTQGLAGQHTLQAIFTTAGGRTVSSAVATVWVLSSTKLPLGNLAQVVAGKTGTVSGRVVGADGSPAVGVKVHVQAQNSLGRAGTDVTVTTGPGGGFTASYKAVSNTVVTATVVASTHYGSSSASVRGVVLPVPTCTLRATAVHGVADPLVCHLGNVPAGTAISVQSLRGGTWRPLVSAWTSGSTWSSGVVFAAKGSVSVRVSLAASKDFGAAQTTPSKVAVS